MALLPAIVTDWIFGIENRKEFASVSITTESSEIDPQGGSSAA